MRRRPALVSSPAVGRQRLGLAGVFVGHDGVEFLHVIRGAPEDLAGGLRVLHAFLCFALVVFVGFADRFPVGAQVSHKIGGHFVGDEFRARRGFGGFRCGGIVSLIFENQQQRVGVPGNSGFARIVGNPTRLGETGFRVDDGARRASDVLEIEHERVEQGFLADARGRLAGLGVVEVVEVLIDVGEMRLRFAALREVIGIFAAKSLDAGEAVVAALVSVVYGGFLSLIFLMEIRESARTRPLSQAQT